MGRVGAYASKWNLRRSSRRYGRRRGRYSCVIGLIDDNFLKRLDAVADGHGDSTRRTTQRGQKNNALISTRGEVGLRSE